MEMDLSTPIGIATLVAVVFQLAVKPWLDEVPTAGRGAVSLLLVSVLTGMLSLLGASVVLQEFTVADAWGLLVQAFPLAVTGYEVAKGVGKGAQGILGAVLKGQ